MKRCKSCGEIYNEDSLEVVLMSEEIGDLEIRCPNCQSSDLIEWDMEWDIN